MTQEKFGFAAFDWITIQRRYCMASSRVLKWVQVGII